MKYLVIDTLLFNIAKLYVENGYKMYSFNVKMAESVSDKSHFKMEFNETEPYEDDINEDDMVTSLQISEFSNTNADRP